MRTCTQCYREIEDPEHTICPDCGATLPKPDEMSSEDASPGAATHTPAPDRPFWQTEIERMNACAARINQINGAITSIYKWNSNNNTIRGHLNTITNYLGELIELCKNYAEFLHILGKEDKRMDAAPISGGDHGKED